MGTLAHKKQTNFRQVRHRCQSFVLFPISVGADVIAAAGCHSEDQTAELLDRPRGFSAGSYAPALRSTSSPSCQGTPDRGPVRPAHPSNHRLEVDQAGSQDHHPVTKNIYSPNHSADAPEHCLTGNRFKVLETQCCNLVGYFPTESAFLFLLLPKVQAALSTNEDGPKFA